MKPKSMDTNHRQHRAGQTIVVVGLGKSGMAAAQFLQKQGHDVTVTDIDPSKTPLARQLEDQGIHTEIGFHHRSTFERADLIVKSPGIPITGEHFEAAVEKGIPILGEMDLACRYIDVPIIAITGTNGKTTVTTLIGEMLEASGKKVFVGGNIGTPLISYVDQNKKADVVVLEVSSFQLDTAHNFAPHVALLLNITEDHINRYPDFDAYRASKWRIFEHQKKDDIAIVNGALEDLSVRIGSIISKRYLFNISKRYLSNISKRYLPNSKQHGTLSNPNNGHVRDSDTTKNEKPRTCKGRDFHINIDRKEHLFDDTHRLPEIDKMVETTPTRLMGRHNRENIQAAAMAAWCAGGTLEGIRSAIDRFEGLPHRTQYVTTLHGIHFYNDSKATNVDAVVRAIDAFDTPIVLIMGGEDKETDFSPLAPWVRDRVKKVVLMGETKEKIRKALSNVVPLSEILMVNDMASAVAQAYNAASSGDTVLLSPACASFDMYESYAHRGRDFMEKVKQLESKK